MDPAVEKVANKLVQMSIQGAVEALEGEDQQRLADPAFQAQLRASMHDVAIMIAERLVPRLRAKKAAKKAAEVGDPIVSHIVACLEGDPRAQEIRQRLQGLDDTKAMKIVVNDLLPIVVRCARSWEQAAA